MKLYLSYVAARERATGRLFFLAEVCHLIAGGAAAVVMHVAEKFRQSSPEASELRAKYSHVLVIVDNNERASYEFPDPKVGQRENLSMKISAAKEAVAAAQQRETSAKLAASVHKEAKADREASEARLADLRKQFDAVILSDAPGVPSVVTEARDPVSAELAELTDEQLLLVAKEVGLEIPEGEGLKAAFSRADLISAILVKNAG